MSRRLFTNTCAATMCGVLAFLTSAGSAYACHVIPFPLCHDGNDALAWRICNCESRPYQVAVQIQSGQILIPQPSIELPLGWNDQLQQCDPAACMDIETPLADSVAVLVTAEWDSYENKWRDPSSGSSWVFASSDPAAMLLECTDRCANSTRTAICEGTCNNPILKDDCGVCGGSGPDICGICGGSGPGECGCNRSVVKDCLGVCAGDAVIDECGVCNGTNKDKGCDGLCFSDKKVDKCGICGGDGSTCENSCTEKAATKEDVRRSKEVMNSAATLKSRIDARSFRAEECGYDSLKSLREKARRLYAQLKALLKQKITNTVQVCTNSVCSMSSTAGTKRELRAVTNRLYRLAEEARIAAHICPSKKVEKANGPLGKNNGDYRDDVLRAINKLPGKKLKC
jgi:hypothetical protein